MDTLVTLKGLARDAVLGFGIDRKSCHTVEKLSEALQDTVYHFDGNGPQRQIVAGMSNKGVQVLNNNNAMSSLLHNLDCYLLTPEDKWKKGKLLMRIVLEFIPEDNS